MRNYRLEVSMGEKFILNKLNLKKRELEVLVGEISFYDEEDDLRFGTEPIILRGSEVERCGSLFGVISAITNDKINTISLGINFIKESQDLYTVNRKKYLDWKNIGEEKLLFAIFDYLYQSYPNAIKDGIVKFDNAGGSLNLISVNKERGVNINVVQPYNAVLSIQYTYPMHHYIFTDCDLGGLMNLPPQIFGEHAVGRTIGSISENIREVFSNMGVDLVNIGDPTLAWYREIKDYLIHDIKDENNYHLCLKRGKDINDTQLGDNLFFNFSTQRVGFVDLASDNTKYVVYNLFNNAGNYIPGNEYTVHIDNLEDFSLGHVKIPSYKNDPSDKNLTDESLNKIKDELHDIVNSSDWRELIDKFHEEIGGEDITYMEFNREGNNLLLCMNGLVGIRDLTLVNFFPNLDPAFIVKSINNEKEVMKYKDYYPEVLHNFFKIVYENLTIDGKKYLDEIKEEK